MTIQTIRGTKDLLFDEWYKFKHIEQTTSRISSLYGFLSAQTPIFEYTEGFTKTLGDSSDIITNDKGGKSITLRLEFTAAVIRQGLNFVTKDRKRQRQFHKINFEVFGVEDSKADVELISLAQHLLTEFRASIKI